MKKLLALIAAMAVITTCFAGCSSKNESSKADTGSKTTTSSTDTKTEKSSTSDNAESTESSEPEEDPYAYYALLDAEYQKTKDTEPFNNGIIGDTVFLYSYSTDNSGLADKHFGYYTYNLFTKETKQIAGADYSDSEFRSGYLYCCTYNQMFCIDKDGNILKQSPAKPNNLTENIKIKYIMADGTAIVEGGLTNQRLYIISADFQSITEMPAIKKMGEHNKEEEIEVYGVIGSKGDELLVTDFFKNVYGFNIKTMEQTDYDRTANSKSYFIGKYLIVPQTNSDTIIDFETGEEIGKTNLGEYRGGSISYSLQGTFGAYSYQAPLGEIVKASEVGTTIVDLKTASIARITPLSDTYYLYRDDYGTFLRKLGSGDADEVAIPVVE